MVDSLLNFQLEAILEQHGIKPEQAIRDREEKHELLKEVRSGITNAKSLEDIAISEHTDSVRRSDSDSNSLGSRSQDSSQFYLL